MWYGRALCTCSSGILCAACCQKRGHEVLEDGLSCTRCGTTRIQLGLSFDNQRTLYGITQKLDEKMQQLEKVTMFCCPSFSHGATGALGKCSVCNIASANSLPSRALEQQVDRESETVRSNRYTEDDKIAIDIIMGFVAKSVQDEYLDLMKNGNTLRVRETFRSTLSQYTESTSMHIVRQLAKSQNPKNNTAINAVAAIALLADPKKNNSFTTDNLQAALRCMKALCADVKKSEDEERLKDSINTEGKAHVTKPNDVVPNDASKVLDLATIFMINITEQYGSGDSPSVRVAMKSASHDELFKLYSDDFADSALQKALQRSLDMVCALYHFDYGDQAWRQVFAGHTICESPKCTHELNIMKGEPRTPYAESSKQTKTSHGVHGQAGSSNAHSYEHGNGKSKASMVVPEKPCKDSREDPELARGKGRAAILAIINERSGKQGAGAYSSDDDNPHCTDDSNEDQQLHVHQLDQLDQLDQQKGACVVDGDHRSDSIAYANVISHLSLFGMVAWYAKQHGTSIFTKGEMLKSIKKAFEQAFITSPFYKDRFRRIIRLAFAMAIDRETTIGRRLAHSDPETLKSKLQIHLQKTVPCMLMAIHKCILEPCIDEVFNSTDNTFSFATNAVAAAKSRFMKSCCSYLIDSIVVLGCFVQKYTADLVSDMSAQTTEKKLSGKRLAHVVNESLQRLKAHNDMNDPSPLTIVEKQCYPSFSAISSESFKLVGLNFNQNEYPTALNQMVRDGNEVHFVQRLETSLRLYNQVRDASLPEITLGSVLYLAPPVASKPGASPAVEARAASFTAGRTARLRLCATVGAVGPVAVDPASTAVKKLCDSASEITQDEFTAYWADLEAMPHTDGRASPTKKMRIDLPSEIPKEGDLKSFLKNNEELVKPEVFYHLFAIVNKFVGVREAEKAIACIRKGPEQCHPFKKKFLEECAKWRQFFANKRLLVEQARESAAASSSSREKF